MKLNLKKVRPIVRIALEEDVGKEDITTNLIIPKGKKAKGIIRAKEKGIIAGLPVAELAFKIVQSPKSKVQSQFKARVKEGGKVKKGQVIAEIIGDARSILTAERTALNFLQRLSGIATLTNRFVEKVKPRKVKIFDTRKTTPGLRYLEKYAVRCGGGYNHRIGLWDMVLIKDNHLKIVQSPKSPPKARLAKGGKVQRLQEIVKDIRKRIPKGMKIEVEAKNLREVKEAAKAGVDIIMLDNMNLKSIRKAVRLIKVQGLPRGSRVPSGREAKSKVEVSGQVSLKNVRKIAVTGVDRISIGALTHSVKALDISLNIVK